MTWTNTKQAGRVSGCLLRVDLGLFRGGCATYGVDPCAPTPSAPASTEDTPPHSIGLAYPKKKNSPDRAGLARDVTAKITVYSKLPPLASRLTVSESDRQSDM